MNRRFQPWGVALTWLLAISTQPLTSAQTPNWIERAPDSPLVSSSELRCAVLPPRAEVPGGELLVEGGLPLQTVWAVLLPTGPEPVCWPLGSLFLDSEGTGRFPLAALQGLEAAQIQVFAGTPLGNWWAGPQVTIQRHSLSTGQQGIVYPPQTGRMVINEIMKDPSAVSDTNGEWIELFNPIWMRQNIEGWTLSDDSGSATILNNGGAGIWVAGRGYRALVRNLDVNANGGIGAAYRYTNFSLGNGADQIRLAKPDGTLVDVVAYEDGGAWPDAPGVSLQLRTGVESPTQNDLGSMWCDSISPYGMGDLGTPGASNDGC